jgi:hypothetical protein
MKGAPLKANRAESKRLSAIPARDERRPDRSARIIAGARVPLLLEQGVSLSHVHPLQAVEPVKERRNAPIHDAMNVHSRFSAVQGRHERVKMRLIRGIERHRNVAVSNPQRRQPLRLLRQRFGMIVQRQIDIAASRAGSSTVRQPEVVIASPSRCQPRMSSGSLLFMVLSS